MFSHLRKKSPFDEKINKIPFLVRVVYPRIVWAGLWTRPVFRPQGVAGCAFLHIAQKLGTREFCYRFNTENSQ
jgi:uncharacterized UPF0160 family protein